MAQYQEEGQGEIPLLLDADVSRGFVVRSTKRGAKRGGIGAVRIRETYLRGDRLLVSMSDTVLGTSSRRGPTHAGEKARHYICPTADFLHCYLELFNRPDFQACFRDGFDDNNVSSSSSSSSSSASKVASRTTQQRSGRGCCSLLLLHSELSKLTGAMGALSIRQERRLVQLARELPGTLVFFDKFCPDLHGRTSVASSTATAVAGTTATATSVGVGAASTTTMDKDGNVTSFNNSVHHEAGGEEGGGGGEDCEIESGIKRLTPPIIMAACGWCKAELGGSASTVTIVSDDKTFGNNSCPAFPKGVRGDGVGLLDLEAFLEAFVRGEAAVELGRRGDLLRKAHATSKADEQSGQGRATEEGGGAREVSPQLRPHHSKTQLETLISRGEVLKGKLDVFEHNPREGVVILAGGGIDRGLEEWTDAGGRAKVLVLGREGMNRSMHGDTVGVALLPRRSWRVPADRKRLTHVAEEDSGADTIGDDASMELQEGGRDSGGTAPPGAMPTGFVVGIIEEGRRPYVVTIPADEATGLGWGGGGAVTVAAVPMDARVPKIRIKTRQLKQLSGQRLVVAVDGWDVGHMFPFGHYVTSLGPVGEVSSEAAALLVECEASFDPFSFNALASLPTVPAPPKESQKPRDALLPPATLAERERPEDGFGKAPRWQDSGWHVRESDVIGRRDLRTERVMSVDPPGCQDIDDAMHVTRKPNGKLEIAVHIADVTRFLEADGPLDKEARVRATTVYLVHRRIDMLPALLSSDLCSLHAGHDRLSVSVFWEAEEDGEDINIVRREDGTPVCSFGRTVIHSRASMTYDQAQGLVEKGEIVKPRGHQEPPLGQAGRDVDESLQPGLAQDLRLMTRFARTTRKERTKNGAIDLSQAGAELKFKIDPVSGAPFAVAGKADSEIHHTIEELMILANSCVAQKIQEVFPSVALLRIHSPPDPSRLTAFEDLAARVGVDKRNGAKGLSESLAAVKTGGLKDTRDTAGLLKSLAVRAMSEAEYVSSGTLSDHQTDGKGKDLGGNRFDHFGLGLSHYTHFTSPIRRYADVVVHRLLLAAIGVTTPAHTRGQGPARKKPPLRTQGGAGISSSLGTEHASLLPPSMAPSVMEMGGTAGREGAAMCPRAGAGDASFVTNPDGTRTYNKVSMSAVSRAAGTSTTSGSRTGFTGASLSPPPPPGMEAFPFLSGTSANDDGDSLLDDLLGLDVAAPFKSETVKKSETAKENEGASATAKSRGGGGGGAKSRRGGNAAAWSTGLDGDDDAEGDSVIDALLGLELNGDPSVGGGAGKSTGDVIVVGGDEDDDDDDDDDSVAASTVEGDGRRLREGEEDMDGEGVVPPFDGASLARLCRHLNDRNRRAKRLAQRCQEMFLRLFFKDHSQVVQGLVLSLRSNGFIAYVPAFDAKGPVYITDVDGHVQVDPALLALPADTGFPASKAFAALPTCRHLPGASVSLLTAAATGSARKKVDVAGKLGAIEGGSASGGEGREEDEILEVRPPAGSGGKVLTLRVLDGVSLRLSCNVLPTQARLPKVLFLLVGVGNRPQKPAQGRTGTGVTTSHSPPRGPTTRGPSCLPGRRGLLNRVVGGEGDAPGAHHAGGGSGGGPVSGDRRREAADGLYRVLQREHDKALLRNPLPSSNTSGSSVSATTAVVAGQRRGKKNAAAVEETARSEVGAGRAQFGGFVPSRQAPAASLYDFGTGDGGAGGGVAALESIYGGGGAGRGGASVGQGTLQTLDEAKVRQLTQEATARAQRLGAEKRNSRVTKSKRKG